MDILQAASKRYGVDDTFNYDVALDALGMFTETLVMGKKIAHMAPYALIETLLDYNGNTPVGHRYLFSVIKNGVPLDRSTEMESFASKSSLFYDIFDKRYYIDADNKIVLNTVKNDVINVQYLPNGFTTVIDETPGEEPVYSFKDKFSESEAVANAFVPFYAIALLTAEMHEKLYDNIDTIEGIVTEIEGLKDNISNDFAEGKLGEDEGSTLEKFINKINEAYESYKDTLKGQDNPFSVTMDDDDVELADRYLGAAGTHVQSISSLVQGVSSYVSKAIGVANLYGPKWESIIASVNLWLQSINTILGPYQSKLELISSDAKRSVDAL